MYSANMKPPGFNAAILPRFGVRREDWAKFEQSFPVNQDTGADNRIFLNGVVTSDAAWLLDWGIEAVSASGVRKMLAERSGPLEVWINSPGGEVFEGSAIAAELRNYSGELTAVVSGLCGSAATFFPIACGKTIMFELAEMMIHLPHICVCGNSEELRKSADTLDKIGDTVSGIYAKRTGKTQTEIMSLMQAETWMTASESLEMGFAHEIRTLEAEPDADDANAMNDTDRLFRMVNATVSTFHTRRD